jgi:hypothetical protein
MRAITSKALQRLNLRSGGMEFASEMVIQASSKGLRISEVPITYHPRRGRSKLSSFSDGWRHLRFMMLYRPEPFLLLPGLLALAMGLALAAGAYLQGGSRMHSLILGSLLLVIGYQMLLAGLYFGAFGATYGEHREALEFWHDEYEELIAFARGLGITMFSTPFDVSSADFLAAFDMPAYKIASGDITKYW